MSVRAATFDDEAEWWTIRARLWPDIPPDELNENIRGHLGGGDQGVFVWDEGEGALQGFVEVSLRRHADGCVTSPVGYLEGWWVAEHRRRNGIGRALVAAAENWAIESGCVEMGSDALLDNEVSRRAHAAVGYQEEEELVNFSKRLAVGAVPRPGPGAGAQVTLRAIVAENVRAVCALDVAAHQRGFVAPNAVSLAQAYTATKVWPRAVYASDTLVGFVMLSDDDEQPRYYVWRFMIDRRFQRRGYGRRAMELTEDYVRTRPGGHLVYLSYVPGSNGPEQFYRSLGYEPTGRIASGEHEMVKVL